MRIGLLASSVLFERLDDRRHEPQENVGRVAPLARLEPRSAKRRVSWRGRSEKLSRTVKRVAGRVPWYTLLQKSRLVQAKVGVEDQSLIVLVLAQASSARQFTIACLLRTSVPFW